MGESIKGLRFIKTFEKCVEDGRKLFIKKLLKNYSNKYHHYIKKDHFYMERFFIAFNKIINRGLLRLSLQQQKKNMIRL